MLTGRDAAHKKMQELIESGEGLPEGVDLHGTASSTTSGPVDPVRDEVVGPAGPTTSTRMDKFTDFILEHTGLLGMIGKAERGPDGDRGDPQARRRVPDGRRRCRLSGVPGDHRSRVVAFPELGMEAIYEFEVKDMPVSVAVDTQGTRCTRPGPSTGAA
jgi:fumarate hydratase class I